MQTNMITRLSRVATLLLLIVAVVAGNPHHAAAQSISYGDWFKLDQTLAGDWTVNGSGDGGRTVVLRRSSDGDRKARRHVFVLYSRASSAYDVAISQAARIFSRKLTSVDMVVLNYDNDEAQARAAVDWADHAGFDLIMAMGSEATAWMWSNYRGPLPVVSMCAKDPVVLGQAKNYSEGTGTNFALTSLNLPPDVQMAFALELKPRLRNLAIIVDSQNVSAVETQAAPIAARAEARGIRVLRLNVRDPSRAAEELGKLVDNAVNAMRLNDPNLEDSLFLITGSTAVFREMETINARASRVPVVSMVPEIVHAGSDSAVLSIGVSFRSNAHLAAIYATSILEGAARPGDLKVGVVSPPDVAINFRRAREIGLKIPFAFFESANVIYDYNDGPVRSISGSEK